MNGRKNNILKNNIMNVKKKKKVVLILQMFPQKNKNQE